LAIDRTYLYSQILAIAFNNNFYNFLSLHKFFISGWYDKPINKIKTIKTLKRALEKGEKNEKNISDCVSSDDDWNDDSICGRH
jgi:hypothetical protein